MALLDKIRAFFQTKAQKERSSTYTPNNWMICSFAGTARAEWNTQIKKDKITFIFENDAVND